VLCERVPVDAVRVDKWLWAARFFKTRGAATEAVLGGHVRRGPASAAATLYEETPGSAEERKRRREERRLARPLGADLAARPTKRDRRRLDALRRAQRRP
jgi:ribosome-associated heat shock protein Hsp15